MAPTPETLVAFSRWKDAELAAHYAVPCPDHVMDHLVTTAFEAFHALQVAPNLTADDMLLKLFPIILRDMEPREGAAPLRPMKSRSHDYGADFYVTLISNLSSVSPALAVAMAEPSIGTHRARVAA